MKLFKRLILVTVVLLISCPFTVYAEYEYKANDIIEIARLLNSEANMESDKGKRLVVDVILNRVDSEDFPNTVSEVLEQKNQFAIIRKAPVYENLSIVCDEINNRSNKKVLFFRTDKYHEDTKPIVKEGDHYFSGK